MSKSKLAAAQKMAEEALTNLRDLAALYQRFPQEPESGSVIRFTKRYTANGRGYSFAALRVGPRWYITGSRSSSSARPGGWMSFDELVEFIGDGKAWVSQGWTEVPTLNPDIPAEGNEELLTQAAKFLDDSSGKSTSETASGLLAIFRQWADDPGRPDGFLQETPTGARFRNRVYPDM